MAHPLDKLEHNLSIIEFQLKIKKKKKNYLFFIVAVVGAGAGAAKTGRSGAQVRATTTRRTNTVEHFI